MHVHLINPLYELREIYVINIYNFSFYLKESIPCHDTRLFLLDIKWRWHYLRDSDFIMSGEKMTDG
jgi:hypothetical protein